MNTISLYRQHAFFCDVELAVTLVDRKRGLLGRTSAGNGLFLMGASAIHTYFMKFDIDVVYLDKNGRLIALEEGLSPYYKGARVNGTAHIIEFNDGTTKIHQIKTGEQWTWIRGS